MVSQIRFPSKFHYFTLRPLLNRYKTNLKFKTKMKKENSILVFLMLSFSLMSLIVRHDVSDDRFIALAKKYPQTVNLNIGGSGLGESTLIKENWLVTAAHAAIYLKEEMETGKRPKVTIGIKQYDIEKVILHPNYKFNEREFSIENDIALIKIKGHITHISYAKLYDKQDEKGKQITIVGRGYFGTALTDAVKSDGINRAATNKIDKVNSQWIRFKFDSPESENTTELEGVSANGDSGGPAFIDVNNVRYIIGVSSHQLNDDEEAVENFYGVNEYYTRISSYKKWIEKYIK